MFCCFAKLHIFYSFSAMPLYFNTDNRDRGVFVDRWWWDMMARAKTHWFSCSFLIWMSRAWAGLCQWMLHRCPWEPDGAGTWVDCLHLHDSKFSYTFIFNLSFELVAQEEDTEHSSHSPSVQQTSLNKLILCSTKNEATHSKTTQVGTKKKNKKQNYGYWK